MLSHLVLHPAIFGFNPLGWLTGHIAGLTVSAFEAVIKALFSPLAKFIDQQLVGWLVTIPNLTQGQVAHLEQTVAAMAGGLLGAVATISGVRYWAAGLAGGGTSGFSALEGLGRTVAAVLMLAVWPWLFEAGVHLTNLFTNALLASGTVTHDVAHLLVDGIGGGLITQTTGVGLFVTVVVAVVGTLLFLGLLLMKLVVTISIILVFIGMPLAIVLWPVAPWVARAAIRAFTICLSVPVLWVLCFAGSAAVADNATLFNAGGVANTLLQPLVAIMLLYMMIRLPGHLAKVAMLGAAPLGGGMVSRAVGYATGGQLRQAVSGAASSRRQNASTRSGTGGQSAAGGRLRKAATIAGATATGGAAAPAAAAASAAAGTGSSPAGAGSAATAAAGSRSYCRPPSSQASATGTASQHGLQTPSFRQEDFEAEAFEAEYRAATVPVSAERAHQALSNLPADTQRGIAELVSRHGGGAREHLAYQATGEWTDQQREALRDLAAATPAVRASALAAATPTPTPAPPSGQPIAPSQPPAGNPSQPVVASSADGEHMNSPMSGQPGSPAPQSTPGPLPAPQPPPAPIPAANRNANGNGHTPPANGSSSDRPAGGRGPQPRQPQNPPPPRDLLD